MSHSESESLVDVFPRCDALSFSISDESDQWQVQRGRACSSARMASLMKGIKSRFDTNPGVSVPVVISIPSMSTEEYTPVEMVTSLPMATAKSRACSRIYNTTFSSVNDL